MKENGKMKNIAHEIRFTTYCTHRWAKKKEVLELNLSTLPGRGGATEEGREGGRVDKTLDTERRTLGGWEDDEMR